MEVNYEEPVKIQQQNCEMKGNDTYHIRKAELYHL
jgi:hypothetical protein